MLIDKYNMGFYFKRPCANVFDQRVRVKQHSFCTYAIYAETVNVPAHRP